MFKNQTSLLREFSILIFVLLMANLTACATASGIKPEPNSDSVFNALTTQPSQSVDRLLQKHTTTAAIINSLRFQVYTSEDGLSSDEVTCILQDDLGFLWIGTTSGLNRFDGYSFVVYRNEPTKPDTLSSNRITALWLDDKGVLWVGTDRGLNRFDREQNRFFRFSHNPSDPKTLANDNITVLFQDSIGDLWVGTQGGGLDQLDLQRLEITHHTFRLEVSGTISSNWINDILEDASGRLWVATENGLNLFDRASGNFETIRRTIVNTEGVQSDRIRALAVDESGLMWLGLADGGVERMEPVSLLSQGFRHKTRGLSLSDDRVMDVYTDSAGRIWAATQSGIDLFDAARNTFRTVLNAQNGAAEVPVFNSYGFSQVFEDRNGLIWAVNPSGGLLGMEANSGRFLWLKPDSDSDSAPRMENMIALTQDREGLLWIAYPTGIDRYSPQTERYSFYSLDMITGGNATTLTSLFVDLAGNLLAGSDRGFFLYDRAENAWQHFTAAIEESGNKAYTITGMPISGFAQTRPSEYWLATRGTGLIRLDITNGKFSVFRYERGDISSLSGDVLTSVIADSNNILWVGTANSGLNRFNNTTGGFVHYTHNPSNPQSLSDNAVTTMLKDSLGRIWVGTASGLNLLMSDVGIFQRYGSAQGLDGEYIRAILEDQHGVFWISTDKGISRLDAQTGEIKNFTARDGLQNGKFSTGAAVLLNDGLMAFGGTRGLNLFISQAAQPKEPSPQIRITKITQNGIPILSTHAEPVTREITLQWPRNYFDFEIAAFSFSQPDENQYAYKLEKFDPEWNWIGTRRFGGYTNLPGGEYTLRVIGANKDGVWNTEGASLRVRVIPAPWENNLLRVAAVLIVALVIFSIVRARLNAISRYNRQLAAEVEERTRDIEKRRRAAEGTREILVRLNSEQPLEESLEFIAGQAADLFGSPRVIIAEIRGRKRIHLAAVHPGSAADFHLQASVQEWLYSFLKMKPGELKCVSVPQLLIEEAKKTGGCLEGVKQVCAAAVYPAGEVYGGIVICGKEIQELTNEERDLLQTMADQVALAVESARLRSEARELAVVSERNRIARDLHDAVTQTLFSASLTADSIPAAWLRDRSEGVAMLNNLRALNRSALAEMRTLLLELRPTAISRTALRDLLEQLANAFSGKTDVKIQISADEVCLLPEVVHVAFYRIAQEALTNAIKHARACQVQVNLRCETLETQRANKNKIVLEICDDGCGFDPAVENSGRFGLTDMRERAQQIGAKFIVESSQGKGTCIQIEWVGRAAR